MEMGWGSSIGEDWYEYGFEVVRKGLGQLQLGLFRALRLDFHTQQCPCSDQASTDTILRGRETVEFKDIYTP